SADRMDEVRPGVGGVRAQTVSADRTSVECRVIRLAGGLTDPDQVRGLMQQRPDALLLGRDIQFSRGNIVRLREKPRAEVNRRTIVEDVSTEPTHGAEGIVGAGYLDGKVRRAQPVTNLADKAR